MRRTNRYSFFSGRNLAVVCVLTGLLSGVVSCRLFGEKRSASDADAGATVAPAAVVAREAVTDAGTSRAVDLLHWGPARLMVSSNVENPRDYPEHLVDGNDATAWNSRTGDLVGASITFEVPADAMIASLVLSAGFAKKGAAGEDLFVMNHRIRTVEVHAGEMEGDPIATLQLDPDRREPQAFPFARAGGRYRLKITAVVPGTKKEWRELAVSEFRVMGTPGAVVYGIPRIPDVAIAREWSDAPLPGIRDSSVPSYEAALGGTFSTVNALCTHIAAVLTPEFAKFGQPVPGPTGCVPRPVIVPAPLPAPLESVTWVDLVVPEGSAGTYMLKTDKGFVIPRHAELQSAPCVPGCMDDMVRVATHLEKVESAGGIITMHVKQASTSSEGLNEAVEHVPATETRWFSLKCPLAPEPVTCARVETKASCTMGTKDVPCR